MKSILIFSFGIFLTGCLTDGDKNNETEVGETNYQIFNGTYYPDPTRQVLDCIEDGEIIGTKTFNGWKQISENEAQSVVNPNLPEKHQHLDSFPRDPIIVKISNDSIYALENGEYWYAARLKNVTETSFTLFDQPDFDECYGSSEIKYTREN